MAVLIQNGRPEMLQEAYLSRYSIDNDNFYAFLLYQRTKSLNLIFYQFLEFNSMANIQDGCQKVTKFYKVVIKLLVQEFFTWDTDLSLLLLSSVYIPF